MLSFSLFTDLGPAYGDDIQAATLWSYLTTHQDIQHLQEWVDRCHPAQQGPAGAGAAQIQWPYHLPLTPNLLDNMSGASQYLKERILNLLARLDSIKISDIIV